MTIDVKATDDNLFAGNSEMCQLMRLHDWSRTPLGAVETWSQSLKTCVRIMLTSRQPMFVWWGDELINLYNDAYKSILGGKHPNAFAQPAAIVWQEIWEQIEPRASSALLNNEGTYDESLLLIMERNGYPEETYYTFSYSPVPDEHGATKGIICANTDNTQNIIGERQLKLLRDLSASTADARTFDTACALSIQCLDTNAHDIPFGIIYLLDTDKKRLTLSGTTSSIEAGHPIAPAFINIDEDSIFSFDSVLASQQISVIPLEGHFNNLPTGAWKQQPHTVVVIPIPPSGETGKSGILIAGLNPYRLFDDSYKGFFKLVSSTIAASITTAQAYEEERKRAEALAEIDQAKTVFFNNVSHEFRTPLTLMLAPVEDILTSPNDPLSSQQQKKIELVQRNGLRLLKLVNILLDFSRIEAGRIQAVYEPTDLANFTADLASVFRSAIEKAGMRLLINCLPLREPVYIDREMWEKIVLNLLSNAFKYTLAGEITVTLQCVNDHVELEVRDTGTGIPKSELPHIFERFHRVSGAKGRSVEGSGIGLSLVLELVKLHGGAINVSSIVDQGTSFTVSIPLGSQHLPQEHIGTSHSLTSTATKANTYVEEALSWLPSGSVGVWESGSVGEKQKLPSHLLTTSPSHHLILLVDDNSDMRDYVRRLLKEQGYNVITANDGIAALEIIEQRVPDIVLTDIMMPRLDGLGLLQRIRASSYKDIPVILLSARAGEEARVEGLNVGADDYLIKPFSARELIARVEACLKLAQLRQESARREHIILERVTDAFVAFDNELRFTYINAPALQLMRKTAEQVLGKIIWEAFPDVTGSPIGQALNKAIIEQVVVEFEEYYAGYNIWLEGRFYPSPSGVSCFYRDVTERKQIEEALQRREVQFRQLADAMPQIVWIANKNGIPEYVNQRWIDYTGLTLEQTANQGFIAQVIHPDDFEPTYQIWNSCLAANTLYQAEFRLRNIVINDNYRWFLCRAIPIHDNAGQITHWYGTLTDISDRKQAENALKESEERFRNMADNAPVMIWVTDAQAYCNYLSPSWYEFTGQTQEEGLGFGWFNALHDDDRENAENTFVTANAQKAAFRLEYRLRRHDGEYFWMIDAATPWFGLDREFKGYIGSVIDISERKQAEVERAKILELERIARAEAEQANRIKDEFLAVLSHELRTPLNPILGWSKLLRTGKLNAEKTIQALTAIERNAKLQAELIEDLLDVSRILQGKLNLNIYPVNLTSVIQAAIETVRLSAEVKSINIQVNFNPVGEVLGDAARLQQVVWNLLSNGVKFTPPGGHVNIELSQIDSYAQITVTDTGIGISLDFLPYVFEYFRQANSTSTRQFGGLGLGLAIVRHLVELHGGTVSACSGGEGHGAIFTIKLPLMSTQPISSNNNQLADELSYNLSGIRVLVVDDETDSRELVAFIVEEYGAEVYKAASANEALQKFIQFTPNLLISDIGMPNMNGYMLIQEIRKMAPARGGKIPAIALTAYAGDYNQQQAIAAGFQQHVTKPIEPEALLNAIANLFT
jgi:PAS domain S-box-containing protein